MLKDMLDTNDIKTIFSFFFKTGLRSARTRFFFLFALTPSLMFIVIRIAAMMSSEVEPPSITHFVNIAGVFYFQLFIQVLCLFYGPSVLNDEIENRTLIYLTTSPASKASVIVGKFLALVSIASIVVTAGLTVSYILADWNSAFQPANLKIYGHFLGVALLALFCYSAFFTMLGVGLKRPILLGLFYAFGWEQLVKVIPGTTQKFAVGHYVRSLLPPGLTSTNNFLTLLREPSSTTESIIWLLLLGLVFLLFSAIIFYKKEFTLADQRA